MNMKRVLQLPVILVYTVALLIPGYTFFIATPGNLQALFSQSSTNVFFTLFRLFGLYAFVFVWVQVMLGSFMPLFIGIFGSKALKFHISQGIFVLLFAFLHPIIFYLASFLATPEIPFWDALAHYFGVTGLPLYPYLGPVALTLMVITVITAKLRARPLLRKHWRIIHFLNYLVFLFSFLHSYNVGSDVHTQPLQGLYIFFGVTFLLGFFYRFGYKRIYLGLKKRQAAPTAPLEQSH